MDRWPPLDFGSFSLKDVQILGSLSLYTGGNVASVRDSSKFDASKLKIKKDLHYLTGGLRLPKLEDYKMANHVMNIFANRSYSGEAWRGIKVPDTRKFFKGIQPGIEFLSWPLSSFTTRKKMAEKFSTMKIKKTETPLIIHVPNLKTGTYIENYTNFESEDEVISNTRLRIIEYKEFDGNNRHVLVCESI